MRRNPHLIEISTYPWLERLSSAAGRRVTLEDVPPAEWDGFADAGFDIVYLMGVWRRSPLGRQLARTDLSLLDAYDRALPGWGMKDVCGSPYCVHAYAPDDRVGGWRGLDGAREQLSRRGIALLLDFVPNHTALDHEWVGTRPELYVTGTLDDYRRHPELFHPIDDEQGIRFVACARDPYFPPWRDVAQLNYFNPATRAAMMEELAAISDHCDGVRCDMAMLVLNDVFAETWGQTVDLLWPQPKEEFWPMATEQVASLAYVAEVYWDRERTLQEQGFDFTYDKRLLDRLKSGSIPDVRSHLGAETQYASRLARFLENHDEPRGATTFGARLPAAAAIALTLPGLRFYFDGQMSGARVHSPVQLGRWPPDDTQPELKPFYAALLRATDLDLFHDGTWMLLDVRGTGDGTDRGLLAHAWRAGSRIALVVANLSDDTAQGRVQLGTLADAAPLELHDYVSGETYLRSADDLRDGLYVRLPPGGAHILVTGASSS